jgi:GT2 family glycosyltransferase
MTPQCSIIVPVHNQSALTRQCLDSVLGSESRATYEIVVVDDASTDGTAAMLAGCADAVRTVTHRENTGFATACNDGAAAAEGEYLVFLNNDTIAQPGWLDALVDHAERNPRASVVGSKLLFPNDTVQHAGVVIGQDGYPRHLYAGFPADHPVVNKSRPFQAVTAACMLVRRGPFEKAGGFDSAYHNDLEDLDLCLRLRDAGHEVHYCHESVLYHLESVSREVKYTTESARLYRSQWGDRVEHDDFEYYIEDGLLRAAYRAVYPFKLGISPLLAFIDTDERLKETERLLDERSGQVLQLLKETIRLTARIASLELTGAGADREPSSQPPRGRNGQPPPPARSDLPAITHPELMRHAREMEKKIHDLQAEIAEVASRSPRGADGDVAPGETRFEPSKYLAYRKLLDRLRGMVSQAVPEDATVLVVSRGDEELLQLSPRRAWHFPQDRDGGYVGHHPGDSAEAIAQLEELRAKGAGYIVFPSTALWWLDHYAELAEHLRSHGTTIASEADTGMVFALAPAANPGRDEAPLLDSDRGLQR